MIRFSKPLLYKSIGLLVAVGLVFVSCKKDSTLQQSTPPLFYSDYSALCVFDSNVISGSVYMQGTATISSGVSGWNGKTWSLLGSGFNGYINSFCKLNGNLIAGTGNVESNNYIGEWNGSSWQTLGGALNDEVNALILYKGTLYAGGYFFTIGNVLESFVVSWNGSSWQSLPGLIKRDAYQFQTCNAFALYNGNLIVAGRFDSAGGKVCNNIAQWNGTTWTSLDSGVVGSINALCIYNGNLIAGGSFYMKGNDSISGIAQWNGSSWQRIGNIGFYGAAYVNAFQIYKGNLIIGSFGVSGTHCLSQWDGTNWTIPFGSFYNGMAPGQPIQSTVSANGLTVYNGNLIVSGSGFNFSGYTGDYIAQWNGSSWSAM